MIKNSEKSFFRIFQVLYWLAYFVFDSQYVNRGNPYSSIVVSSYFLFLTLGGAFLSLILKYVYDLDQIKRISQIKRIFLVIVLSFLLGNVWLIEVGILDHSIHVMFNYPVRIDYIGEVVFAALVFVVWSIFYLLFTSWYDISAKQKDIEKAHLLAKNAQLNALRYQLNPHFLFNVLNSIRALIYKSPQKADEMISGLSEFMRYSLSHKDDAELPLADELSIIKNYLEIEKIRYGERLKYNIDIDQIAEEYPIPPFIILPLVDNAVKYGMKTSQMPLKIDIKAEIVDDELIVAVKNSGSWIKNTMENENAGTGTGLDNIRKRLANIFQDDQSLVIKKGNGRVEVEIKIFRKLEDDEYEKA